MNVFIDFFFSNIYSDWCELKELCVFFSLFVFDRIGFDSWSFCEFRIRTQFNWIGNEKILNWLEIPWARANINVGFMGFGSESHSVEKYKNEFSFSNTIHTILRIVKYLLYKSNLMSKIFRLFFSAHDQITIARWFSFSFGFLKDWFLNFYWTSTQSEKK